MFLVIDTVVENSKIAKAFFEVPFKRDKNQAFLMQTRALRSAPTGPLQLSTTRRQRQQLLISFFNPLQDRELTFV